ncbi:transposase [Xenorhabdus kozodoii]|uniref:Transposase n=1 Tax=Xenorhabdus kozodoii TaxID=351676 RepID=A0A2D0KY79_9GAMM|nr:transposase [Xenorhabdus kozodoii]
MIIDDCGEILSVKLTPGNVDDRQSVKELVKGLTGHLYGDKDYLSQVLCDELKEEGLTLITNVRRSMKAKFLSLWDKAMLRKRFLIETVNDQLKNISQIEHSRHRSVAGFLLEIVSGLIAYIFQPKKPSLGLRDHEMVMLKQS